MSLTRYPAYRSSEATWLGEIPKAWEVRPLKHLAKFVNGEAFKPTEWTDQGTPIIRIQNLNGGEDFNCFDGNVDRRYHILKGALLFGWSGNRGTSFGPFIWMRDGLHFLNQHIFSVSPIDCDFEWLYWCLKEVTLLVEQKAHGIIGMVHVTKGKLENIDVPVPSPSEQTQIAKFLSYETEKIDALVAEHERLIGLLKEKRQAVISHAVTKGLDPNVPMKDSGVEWMGEVPSHWAVVGLSKVTSNFCDGPFGSGLKSEHYTDTGVRVIRLQNIRAEGFSGTDVAYIDEGYYTESLSDHDVRTGDLLIAGLGDDRNTVGRACVAPENIEPAMVKADCFRFRLKPERSAAGFVALQLTSGSAYDAGMLSSGSTRSRIPLSVMSKRKVALPPPAEQQRIIKHLELQTSTFNLLISESEHVVELLQERRSALISAAVTGKIDVRGLAPAIQEAA